MSWERLREALEELRLLLEELRSGSYSLRHGLAYVRVSDLVEQARCEARLDALLSMGVERELDERARLLAKLSELALGARRSIPEEPPRSMILSVPVAGVVAGVPIVGRPRGLHVEDGAVKAIVYASTSARPNRLYYADRVRAAAFCAALHASPLPRGGSVTYIHVKGEDREVLFKRLSWLQERLLEGVGAPRAEGVHILVCDEEASVRFLEPLLQYWLGLREPRATPGPWCSDCPVNGSCPAAPQRGLGRPEPGAL